MFSEKLKSEFLTEPYDILKLVVGQRLVRFAFHAEQCSDAIITRSGDGTRAKPSSLLLKINGLKQRAEEARSLTDLCTVLDNMSKLHCRYLPSVPGIDPPLELISFLRQTMEDFEKKYTVHGCEAVDDAVLYQRPLNSDLVELQNAILGVGHPEPEGACSELSLPRMDLGAPIRWPTLHHEQQHVTCNVNLVQEFRTWLSPSGIDSLESEIIKEIRCHRDQASSVLQSWVLEVVCDLGALKSIGPAIFFAQAYAFLSDVDYWNGARETFTSHPPPNVRLLIIKEAIRRRYETAGDSIKELIVEEANKELAFLKEVFVAYRATPHPLMPLFRMAITDFLLMTDHFNQTSSPVEREQVDYITSKLKKGRPVPTLKDGSPSSIPALLVGAILLRHYKSPWEFTLFSDEAIRRSIQLREWIKVLNPNTCQKSEKAFSESVFEKGENGLLVDKDILNLLRDANDPLEIIPIINSEKQIGSASIDLRLGHYFEVFNEGVSGVVDFVQEDLKPVSREVCVDMGHGIILSPGRFILAHTLEYIHLPKHVCGQVEGRSSFARLGIQVHMTANLIDCGFSGVITLEVLNMGPNPIRLYPGTRIAQLRLFRCSVPNNPYSIRNKYFGRLRHNISRQGGDPELALIREQGVIRGEGRNG